MVIPIGQGVYNFKDGAYPLDRGYWFKPQQSLKDLDCVENGHHQNFYPFYGTTSIRRQTAIFKQHRNDRKKKINRKNKVPKSVERVQKLNEILRADHKSRKYHGKNKYR